MYIYIIYILYYIYIYIYMVNKFYMLPEVRKIRFFFRVTFSSEEIKNQFYIFWKADVEIRPNPRSF